MATYHICDLCGKNLKDGPIYFIAVGPSISVREPTNKDINEVRKSCFFERIEPHSNKEVCKECAKAWSDIFNKLDELKSTPDWDARIYSPKYEDVNSKLHYRDNIYKMEVSMYD